MVRELKQWHDVSMDVLRTPLLDDDDRRRAFFEALPELFLSEFLNELKNNRYFSYFRINTLEEYDMLVARTSFKFERKTYNDVYVEFNESFDALKAFTEKNFFTEGNRVVLHSTRRKTDSEQYQTLVTELNALCLAVADRYKRLANVLTRDRVPSESKTSVTRSNNTLHFDDKNYTIRSKEKQELIRSLWSRRVNKKNTKKAEWTDPANVAVSMGLIESARDYDDKVANRMYLTIKDMNKYLDEIGFPVDITKNKEGYLLIVVSS